MFGYCYAEPWRDDVEENFREISKLGYKGIDIWRPPEALGDPSSFKAGLDKAGLVAISITAIRPEMMAKETVDYASAIGAKYIGVHAFIDLLDEKLADYASKRGISFVIHPHLGTKIENIQDVSRYLKKYPKLMFCPDIANLTAAGSNPVKAIEMFKDRLSFVHLKDWDQTIGFCELGEGSVDIQSVFRMLEKINYSGWLVIETTKPSSKAPAIKCRDYLKQHGYW